MLKCVFDMLLLFLMFYSHLLLYKLNYSCMIVDNLYHDKCNTFNFIYR